MLSYAAMKRLLILAFVLFAFPAVAGERTPLGEYLDSMPPMDARDRAAFDKAARSIYNADCNCLRFLHEGRVDSVPLPLNPGDRTLLIEMIRRGMLKPFPARGTES